MIVHQSLQQIVGLFGRFDIPAAWHQVTSADGATVLLNPFGDLSQVPAFLGLREQAVDSLCLILEPCGKRDAGRHAVGVAGPRVHRFPGGLPDAMNHQRQASGRFLQL